MINEEDNCLKSQPPKKTIQHGKHLSSDLWAKFYQTKYHFTNTWRNAASCVYNWICPCGNSISQVSLVERWCIAVWVWYILWYVNQFLHVYEDKISHIQSIEALTFKYDYLQKTFSSLQEFQLLNCIKLLND